MAQAITLTLSEEEAHLVLNAVRSSSSMMGHDSRHSRDREVLDRVTFQLEAHLKAGR
jgi:hypothetical protein